MPWTRRQVLALCAALPVAAQPKGRTFASERFRYADPATDFPVFRLTNPEHASAFPDWYGRAIARNAAFLLFWSDRTGPPQAFRLNLPGGAIEQLTDFDALEGGTLRLTPDDRSFHCFDGPSLLAARIDKPKSKELYRVSERWTRGDYNFGRDASRFAIVERQEGGSRLRILHKGAANTVAEGPWAIAQPVFRPRRDELLYRAGDALYVAGWNGRAPRRLPLPPGKPGPAFWSPDGKTVLYLHLPEDPRKLSAIRECDPDAGAERLVAETSQFAHFAPNGDASVFVGACRSKASPEIVLLLRSVRRELTLCEHGATDAARVQPFFAPGSQQVFFQSDREGKMALYAVSVDRLVERTEA